MQANIVEGISQLIAIVQLSFTHKLNTVYYEAILLQHYFFQSIQHHRIKTIAQNHKLVQVIYGPV